MANEEEFRIKITTSADGKGAKDAAADLEKVNGAADKAKRGMESLAKTADKTGESASHASEKIKGMGEAGESAEYGFRGTEELAGALAMTLRGDLAGGALQAGGAIEAVSKALLGGPWGIAAVALGALAGVIASITSNSDKAEDKTEDLGKSLDKLSPKSRELAGKLLEIAKAASEQAEKSEKSKTSAEQMADAFKKAADEAARYKQIRDELATQDAALAVAETNLAEARGKITAEQAEAQRNAIQFTEKQRKADNSVIGAGYEKNRALENLRKADTDKQSADAAAYRANKQFEAAGGQFPFSPDAVAEQIRKSDEKLKKVEGERFTGNPDGTPFDSAFEAAQAREQFDKDKAERVEQARKELEAVKGLAAAYANLTEAEDKAAKAEDARKVAQKGANEAIDKANREIRQQQVDRKVATDEAATNTQKAANEAAKGKQDFDKRSEGMRERGIRSMEREFEDREKGAQPAAPASHGAPGADQRGGLLDESRSLARDIRGTKGRSPEDTHRLEQAADKLLDGLQGNEGADIGGVLDKVANSLEKVGKVVEAQNIRGLAARVSKLESAMYRVEGIANRLAADQGNTGS